ncbi:hypothetical protein BGZ63DRAFT_487646 [Mariannaea sp. PMI_226]|nr:hypothetical protein BGZ63DRAFT_487646 [Mariannaea sp. PMI_226]
MGGNGKMAAATTVTSTPHSASREPKVFKPPRVVTEILPPAIPGFTMHPRILSAQSEWERNRSMGGSNVKQAVLANSAGANTSEQLKTKPVKRGVQDSSSSVSKKRKTGRTSISNEYSSPKTQNGTQETTTAAYFARTSSPSGTGSSADLSSNTGLNSLRSETRTPKATSQAVGTSLTNGPTPSSVLSSTKGMSLVRAEASRSLTHLAQPSNQKALNTVRAEARRFAERAIQKQLDELNTTAESQNQDENPDISSSEDPESPTFAEKASGSHIARIRAKAEPEARMKADLSQDNPVATSGFNEGKSVTALIMADAERPYSMYQGPDGKAMPGRGTMFPTKYELHDLPDLPYVCPVRDCRRLFKNLNGLAGHWGAGHCGRMYNDNGDGTLSLVGTYVNKGPGGAPGIVVSQERINVDAPPPVAPSLSYWGNLKRMQSQSESTVQALKEAPSQQTRKQDDKPAWTVGRTDDDSNGTVTFTRNGKQPHVPRISSTLSDTTGTKQYLHSLLKPEQRVFKREDVRQMIQLPRKRSLPPAWIAMYAQTELDATNYTCALAYLTGDEVTGSRACSHTNRPGRPAARLSAVCVKLSPTMTSRAHKLFFSTPTCVGCRYTSHVHRQKNNCDWSVLPNQAQSETLANVDVLTSDVSAAPPSRRGLGSTGDDVQSSASDGMHQSLPILISDKESTTSQPEVLESEAEASSLGVDNSRLELQRPKRNSTTPTSYALSSSLRKESSRTTDGRGRTTETIESTRTVQTVHKIRKVGGTEVRNQFDGSALEMEDWEVAPGRMVDKSSQNIAFSNSYLTSGQPVKVSDDVRFNVHIIKPGASMTWSVDDEQLLMVSVAAGKLKVTMNDQTFQLGPNGMFVVRQGHSCRVENRLYIDSVGPPATPATPNTQLDVPSGDRDSISVNPGSPPSPLPPLSNYATNNTNGQDAHQPADQHQERETSETMGTEVPLGEEEESPVHPARFILDPAGELTHDQTTVDIVTVPCPGGNPLKTWSRDALMGRYFGAPAMRDAEGAAPNPDTGSTGSDRPVPSWVRQGIRREADRARIALYEHPTLDEKEMSLSALADALLEELMSLRVREDARGRPVIFVGHSIGGLVVKMALVKASRNPRFEDILKQCYGVAFFGTPHQGSSYFAMPSLATSIQILLQLSSPLPSSITNELRVGNHLLLHLDDDFKAASNDLRVWTLYETIDSRLSGAGSGDVYFTAPLTSVKSAVLGMRQETILPLQSDHANMASFGRHNVHTLRLFLKQLSALIQRADEYSVEDGTWSLNLEQKVSIEVHGFFEDLTSTDSAIRAWSTRLPLKEFLRKGPNECLADRLNEVEGVEESRFLSARGRTSIIDRGPTNDVNEGPVNKNALGIDQEGAVPISPPMSPVLRPMDVAQRTTTESAPQPVPGTPIATPPSRRGTSPPSRYSSPAGRLSPAFHAGLDQDLVIDRLSPPVRGRMGRSLSRSFSMGSRASPYEYRDFPPFSQRSRSTFDANFSEDEDIGIDASPRLPESVLAIRNAAKEGRRVSETVVMDEIPATVPFSKPEADAKKFLQLSLISPRGSSSKNQSLSPSPEGTYSCLFLPYLHFDSYKKLVKRREAIIHRLKRGRVRPIPEDIAKSDSLEIQVIWRYLGDDPPLNCRRTLDQFGYPSLRDTRSRDDDQMLYKLTKERSPMPGEHVSWGRLGSMSSSSTGASSSAKSEISKEDDDQCTEEEPEDDVRNGNVLMVDQLWLWAIDAHTLLSFFPRREGDAIEGPLYQQADLRDSIFHEVNVDMSRQCENALDLAALAAFHAVSVLIDKASHPDLEVFRIFEEAISVLNEKLTSSLKTFRAEGLRNKAMNEPSQTSSGTIKARHLAEGQRAEEDNRDNTSALLELRDIEDELQMLLHLFERQSKVINSMHSTYARPEIRDRTANGRIFLAEALKRLSEYVHQTQEMMQRVRNTRNDYDKLLQMVQRQAQVDEVRLSRLHADLASTQSRSVMVFTTFTVIFLPLSFFTGLFGMNTREWGGGDYLPLATIGAIAVPSSFVLVVTSLILAWSETARRFTRWLTTAAVMPRKKRRGGGGSSRAGLAGEEGEPSSTSGWARSSKARGGIVQETSDFWERHRLERERGYQIPEKNKRNVARAEGRGSWRWGKGSSKEEKGRM